MVNQPSQGNSDPTTSFSSKTADRIAVGTIFSTLVAWGAGYSIGQNCEQRDMKRFLDSKDTTRSELEIRGEELRGALGVVSSGVRADLQNSINAHNDAVIKFNKELGLRTRGEEPLRSVEMPNKAELDESL